MEQGTHAGDWDATLTLWREAVADGSTAMDSIRAMCGAYPEAWKTKPRPRSLATGSGAAPDFELGERLGAGGMGVVYAANQTAFGRKVAVKMVKPERKGSGPAADALLAEAVVTGRLEHPNVVPVYDLGIDAEGNLFYAMKEVQGSPWSQLMPGKTLDENLGILLRVADTVSFAHSRGVLHRDLKPHNIMLGEFGEVMVMDWGAFCPVVGEVAGSASSTLCGTPAYMPPEMARMDIRRQGVASDVYLLGAVLYQIVAGHPPRREKDPVLCLNLASGNHIEPAEGDAELLRIALKAMAAVPADRFARAGDFQQAVRGWRAHSESLLLLENAKAHLFRARQAQDYGLFSRALFGFLEAIELWPDNPDAGRQRAGAAHEYARCAFGNNDYELAQSLLDPADPAHRELLDLVGRAIRGRDAHKRRSRRLLLTARLLVVLLLLVFAAGYFLVRSEHRKNLAMLIAAHYGEQNHEAAVAAFWRFHDRFGMEALEGGTLLDVRVAAAMNPWRGALATGIGQPLGLMPAADRGCVWVAGHRVLKKVRLEPGDGYDPATVVSIHDFKFGKRLPPGRVVETVPLPFELARHGALHEGADGALWAGSGSMVYRKVGADWNPVLDVGQLQFPPLPAEFGFDTEKRDAFRQWMDREAHRLPITGLLLNRAQDRAVVALGGGAVCWIDLPAQTCLGWYFVDMDTPLETLKYETNLANFTPDKEYGFARPLQIPNGPQLLFSPDETLLLYREGCRGTFAFAFTMPGFVRKKYFYSRLYKFGDFAFQDNERCWGMLDYQGVVFSASAETLSRHWGSFDGGRPNRWDTVEYATRRIPFGDWALATLSPDGMDCLLVTRENMLYSGATVAERGFDFKAKIAGRDWVDCMLAQDGTALALTRDGAIHAYDTRRHAMQALELNGKVVDVCAGHHPDHVFAVLEKPGGRNDVLEISGIRSSAPRVRVVAADTPFALVCCDPKGRWLVAQGPQEGKVFELATGNVVGTIPSERGTLFPIKFDERGDYLLCGGEWKHIVKIHRAGDWKKVMGRAPEKLGIAHLALHRDGDEPRVLATMNGAALNCLRLEMDLDAPSNLVWAVRAGDSGLSTLPYVDPVSGRRRYWLRTWFDRFQGFDPSTGTLDPDVFTHWQKKEFKFPVYNETGTRVLLPTEGGRVEMALRSDLYPVFDPRAIDRNVDKAAFNSDESMAALVADGRLLLMNLAGTLASLPQGQTPAHHVSKAGLNLWPYDSWETAATGIHDAVRTASTGDTVLLDDGVFHAGRTIVVQDAITLRSRNGPGKTSVTSDGNGVVFHFRSKVAGLATLDGITVTGGNGPYGGGLFFENTCGVTVTNCIISGNTAGTGAAMYIGNEEPPDAAPADPGAPGRIWIVDSVLKDNTSTGPGGGISTWIAEAACGRLAVERCEISGNRAAKNGGGMNLYAEGFAPIEFIDCVVSNNAATGQGGGVFIHPATSARMQFLADGCEITANTAGKQGGGVKVQNPGTTSRIDFRNCRIEGFLADDPNGTCTVGNSVLMGTPQGGTWTDCTFEP